MCRIECLVGVRAESCRGRRADGNVQRAVDAVVGPVGLVRCGDRAGAHSGRILLLKSSWLLLLGIKERPMSFASTNTRASTSPGAGRRTRVVI